MADKEFIVLAVMSFIIMVVLQSYLFSITYLFDFFELMFHPALLAVGPVVWLAVCFVPLPKNVFKAYSNRALLLLGGLLLNSLPLFLTSSPGFFEAGLTGLLFRGGVGFIYITILAFGVEFTTMMMGLSSFNKNGEIGLRSLVYLIVISSVFVIVNVVVVFLFFALTQSLFLNLPQPISNSIEVANVYPMTVVAGVLGGILCLLFVGVYWIRGKKS